MRAGLAAIVASVGLLTGCLASAAPTAPTEIPATPVAPTAVPPTPVPPTAVQPTATSTPRPTLVPTPTPTPMPTPLPSPTPPQPTPTPDPLRAVQQHFCDTASPPARLPLPPGVPIVHITLPAVLTLPTPVANGPRQEGADSPPVVTARHVAVLDEASGSLLYAYDAFSRQAPASITKIVTAIVALERGPDIKTIYTTSVSASALAACDGSSIMGLEPNDHVTLETLLFGMMLPSGNDAAEQVAVSLAGSREQYVGWMNDKVAALHLRDTHFVTPSGMDADEHYSSAYDMALLGRYAMQNPEFRRLAGTARFVGDDYYLHNLNPLLTSYPGADGVKIGYTPIAGRTIVASTTRSGHRVYVSLLNSRNLSADSIALFDWVWKSFRW
jgi:D-alanyl-D-alanine carboxypeptidase